jgi:hypothetical protein
LKKLGGKKEEEMKTEIKPTTQQVCIKQAPEPINLLIYLFRLFIYLFNYLLNYLFGYLFILLLFFRNKACLNEQSKKIK